MRIHDFNLVQCYFGEHLLSSRPQGKVMIVESEKTAIVCAHYLPEYIWIATGGIGNLRYSEALAGRDVTLVPDLGAEEKWREQMALFEGKCRSVLLSGILSDYASEDQKESGLDLADFLLMEQTPHGILEKWKSESPELDEFIRILDLTVEGFGEEVLVPSGQRN